MQDLREGIIEQSLSTTVSEDYAPTILNNEQFMNQLGHAEITKVIHPQIGLSISYFQIVNIEEDIQAIVEVSYERITHIYASNIHQSEEEEAKRQKLMEQMEQDGESVPYLLIENELTNLLESPKGSVRSNAEL